MPLTINSVSSNNLLWMFQLFVRCDGADQSTSSLPGFSDKLDFLDGDQKPPARGSKEGAKGQKSQQTKKGYCFVLFCFVVCVGPAVHQYGRDCHKEWPQNWESVAAACG